MIDALSASLLQLLIGFGLTLIPFAVGALWQRGRADFYRARADWYQERYDDLLWTITPGNQRPSTAPATAHRLPLQIVRDGS